MSPSANAGGAASPSINRAEARSLIAALQSLRQSNPDMTCSQAVALLSVYAEPKVSMAKIGEELGVSKQTVSGIVADLEKGRGQRDGLGFVQVLIDPMDKRYRLLDLTAKGRRTAQAAIDAALPFLKMGGRQ